MPNLPDSGFPAPKARIARSKSRALAQRLVLLGAFLLCGGLSFLMMTSGDETSGTRSLKAGGGWSRDLVPGVAELEEDTVDRLSFVVKERRADKKDAAKGGAKKTKKASKARRPRRSGGSRGESAEREQAPRTGLLARIASFYESNKSSFFGGGSTKQERPQETLLAEAPAAMKDLRDAYIQPDRSSRRMHSRMVVDRKADSSHLFGSSARNSLTGDAADLYGNAGYSDSSDGVTYTDYEAGITETSELYDENGIGTSDDDIEEDEGLGDDPSSGGYTDSEDDYEYEEEEEEESSYESSVEGSAVEGVEESDSPCFTGMTSESASRCEAYKCAEIKAGQFSRTLDDIGLDAGGAVADLLNKVKNEDVLPAIELVTARQDAVASLSFSCYGCDVLNECVDYAAGNSEELLEALNEESAKLDADIACAGGSAEDVRNCKEDILATRAHEQESVVAAAQSYVGLIMSQVEACAAQVPETKPGPVDENGNQTSESNDEGLEARDTLLAAAAEEILAYDELITMLEPDWCQRHSGSCSAASALEAIQELRSDDDWTGAQDEFSSDADAIADAVPSDVESAADEADDYLTQAEEALSGASTLAEFIDGVAAASEAVASYESAPEDWSFHVTDVCEE